MTHEINQSETHQQETPDLHQTHATHPQRGGWLWVSAGVMAALIVVQGAGLLDQTAHAEMAVTSGSYSMATTDGGNDEILAVVDSRQESLMIYRTINNNRVQLLDREDLATLFTRARSRSFGQP